MAACSIETNASGLLVSGELDVYAAPALREKMIERARETIHLELDLSATTFIDSTAIGVIAGRLRQLLGCGGSVTIVGANHHIRDTFEMAGMTDLLEFKPTPHAVA